jgi:hypothetical protein
MRGLSRWRSAVVIAAGHALVQNIPWGHYELGVGASSPQRLAAAFSELAGLSDLIGQRAVFPLAVRR